MNRNPPLAEDKNMQRKRLGLGKLSRNELDRLVLKYLPNKQVELDGAVIDLKENTVVAHSPSIGVPLDALGFFAFHYSSSNVAVKFGIPLQMISGIYLPLGTREKDLRVISRNLGQEAEKFGVKIVAGQTATYRGIESPLVTSTCIGQQTRKPGIPVVGDIIAIIGEIGGEALWLKSMKERKKTYNWRSFTPLPVALELQDVEGVKMMHDISEGGVIGALYEVSNAIGLKIDIELDKLSYVNGAKNLGMEILKAPTYGSLVTIFEPDALQRVKDVCENMDRPLSILGRLDNKQGVYVESRLIDRAKRGKIDEIYGNLEQSDEILRKLSYVLEELEIMPGFEKLIPEVGANLVYAKPEAEKPIDVAALSGRMVKAENETLLCGEVTYGGSKHLSSVVLASKKLKSSMRAAINIKFDKQLIERLQKLELELVKIPSELRSEICPVTAYIKKTDSLSDVYIHPGVFGIEPSITIIAREPEELLEIIRKIV